MKRVEDCVGSIPDSSEPGIIFRGVTMILQDTDGLHLAVDEILDMLKDVDFDAVADPESRDSILGVPAAYVARKGFVLVREKGELPCETVSTGYDLECGGAVVEIYKDTIKLGQKVVIVDDSTATGGIIEAIIKLTEGLGDEMVKICFVMELVELREREKLSEYDVDFITTYEGN